MHLAGDRKLDCSAPQIMGILNVTPDSFSDGGQWTSLDRAVAHALGMAEAGAAIIDVGGESTRPGAAPVSLEDELQRVVPVVAELSRRGLVVSVDTSKAQVMTAAAAAGAAMVNDVRALREQGALAAVAQTDLGVCLMHMQGEPRSMQKHPVYADVVEEVREFLLMQVAACETAGIARQRIALDPGFGFGKTLVHNLALLNGLPRLVACGLPVLVGLSRKSMLQALTGRPVEERLAGSLALAVMSARAGAHIIRVHDVAQTRDALAVVTALRQLEAHGEVPE